MEFTKLLQSLTEDCDSVIFTENAEIITAHDKVLIDPKALGSNAEELIKRKGQPYYNQLKLLANEKRLLTVTAIKRVNRTSANFTDGGSSTWQDEVDVVSQFNPGNFHSPMSLPINILVKHSDYNGSFQTPLDDSTGYKPNTQEDTISDYNDGKQPKGTRHRK